MFTKILKCIWFVSSYMPLYFLLIIYNLDIQQIEDKSPFYSLYKAWNDNAIFNWVMLGLCILSILSLSVVFMIKSNRVMKCQVSQIKNGSPDVLNYFITYLFPILTMDIENGNSVFCNIIIFIIIGMFYLQSEQLHWNPTLIFMRIKIFEINGNIVLTRKDRKWLEAYIADNSQIWIHEISPGVYFEKESK